MSASKVTWQFRTEVSDNADDEQEVSALNVIPQGAVVGWVP